jgi:hypothetical protein
MGGRGRRAIGLRQLVGDVVRHDGAAPGRILRVQVNHATIRAITARPIEERIVINRGRVVFVEFYVKRTSIHPNVEDIASDRGAGVAVVSRHAVLIVMK